MISLRSLRQRSVTRGLMIVMAMMWVAGVAFGMRFMLRYEKTPGQLGEAPRHWPVGVPETGQATLPTLVVALHPRCSCSAASLNQLSAAAETFHHPYNALLLIDSPHGVGVDWQDNRLYRQAQKELHAQVVTDTDGLLATKFGLRPLGR